jgi:hypothetical protein
MATLVECAKCGKYWDYVNGSHSCQAMNTQRKRKKKWNCDEHDFVSYDAIWFLAKECQTWNATEWQTWIETSAISARVYCDFAGDKELITLLPNSL